MRDFPSCFGENGVQIADSSSSSSSGARQTAQNLVTCVYQSKLCGRSCLITVTWSKSLMGQGMSVGIDDATSQSVCKVDIKPWLFSKRKGCKTLEVDGRNKVDIYWDLSSARFGSGPEPLDGYYLALVVDCEMVLLLGDLRKEAYRKTNAGSPDSSPMFVAKREHIFGKRVYCTKAQFCDNGQVKRLAWKFRGNQTILVDGLPVEVFWDVHNWLFSQGAGSAVFMFQTSLSAEKLWSSQNFSDSSAALRWSGSQTIRERQSQALGFSLILYAWKNE